MDHVKFYWPFYGMRSWSANTVRLFDISCSQDDKAVELTRFMKDVFAHLRFY